MPLSYITTGSVANNISIVTTGNVSANVVSAGGSAVSPVASFRNKVINGNFDYWQRGTSFTDVLNVQYCADRWNHPRVGSTANVSRQTFTLGQTDVPNEPSYFHRTVVTSVANAANYVRFDQRIESVRTLAGQTATLSFWAKADASKNIAVEFAQTFGTGGSPSSAVTAIGVTTCALTTSWKKFMITANIPSISGKTLGTDNNDVLILIFWFDAGSNFNSRTNSLGQQSGTFDIAQVQLEAGSVATPFEVRPPGVELQLCQRYYEQSYSVTTVPGSNLGLTDSIEDFYIAANSPARVRFAVSKRVAPSMTIWDAVGNASRYTRDSIINNTTPIAVDNIGTSGFKIYTQGTAQSRASFHWAASAEL
jgi:hypothetical protein